MLYRIMRYIKVHPVIDTSHIEAEHVEQDDQPIEISFSGEGFSLTASRLNGNFAGSWLIVGQVAQEQVSWYSETAPDVLFIRSMIAQQAFALGYEPERAHDPSRGNF